MNAPESIGELGKALINREGLLGFLILVGTLALGWYIYDGHKRQELLTEILVRSQSLQEQAAKDEALRTDAIERNTETMNFLADMQKLTSESVNGLVNVVSMRLEHDKITLEKQHSQGERFLDKLGNVQSSTERSERHLEDLKIIIKTDPSKKP